MRFGVWRLPLSLALHWAMSPGRVKNCFCSPPNHASQNLKNGPFSFSCTASFDWLSGSDS